MEEVLLRVAVVGGEALRGEGLETGLRHALALEVKFFQRPFHPNVHRKGLLFAVSKEQDAIRDFGADTGQLDEGFFGGKVGKPAQCG